MYLNKCVLVKKIKNPKSRRSKRKFKLKGYGQIIYTLSQKDNLKVWISACVGMTN
jgi:hypothetical protein